MTNIHLRRLDEKLIFQLKQTASSQNISVNTLILNLIAQGLGVEKSPRKLTHHELDKLAGTWTAKEAETFMKTMTDFEQIDKELWK
ncbi:MAG: hypothetical protein EPO11_06715 [Gammaproteobacteria bacterium]|nr:MAG: hypothetical protein EPO11_06715 [Gammaproteobacteria bacterium]